MKINDDRKVKVTLSQMKKPGRMILLLVRCFEGVKPREGEFDRAWYRVVNEDTNQTIDYKKIKDIDKPEGWTEEAEEEGDGPRKEITYVAGRLFLERNGRWVYEGYHHCFTNEKVSGDLVETLGAVYQRSEEEVKFQAEEIQRARDKVAANEEERRQAAKTAAAKKKGGKGKKDQVKEEEEEKREEKVVVQVKKELDLFLPKEFAMAVQQKIPRPFIFGPVEFTNLNEPSFPYWEWRERIQDILLKSPYLPENVCIHGFEVTVRKRNLKRASTVVKHSRFLRNMEVFPVFPPEPEPVQVVEEGYREPEEEEEEND